MPIYEFKCPKCGAVTSELRKMDDRTPPICPKCNIEMKPMISVSYPKFIGSGFPDNDRKKLISGGDPLPSTGYNFERERERILG